MLTDIIYPVLFGTIMFFIGFLITELIGKDLVKRRLKRIKELESIAKNNKVETVQSEEQVQQWRTTQKRYEVKRSKDTKLINRLFFLALTLTIITLLIYLFSDFINLVDKKNTSKIFMYCVIFLSMMGIYVSGNRPK